ncbi:nuclear transport factor 2 family protein [Sphingobium sp. MK2]|uniref:nuclear transport factor 2 family protein n=1 Tax=Sphingobium sp. MK2 TaxID=3116540 RepID=UPI0032E35AFE
MDMTLPRPIADYFAADKGQDVGAISACFTNAATVKDEGNSYQGRDAIKQWKAESSQKYTYSVEPFSIAVEGEQIIVTSHLVGDFPGSPLDLRYFFILDGEKIARLEIKL